MKLVGQKGPAQGNEWSLKGDRLTIGRDPATDIYVADPKISRLHAEILRKDDQLVVVDNRSTNGTFLNGMRITEGVLREGDLLKVGNCEFQVTTAQRTDEFGWGEANPEVTASISVNALHEELERTRSTWKHARRKAETITDEKARTLARLVEHLHVIYDLQNTLQEVRNRQDIIEALMGTLLQIFPQALRACILLNEGGADKDMVPVTMHSQDTYIGMEFRISRNVVHRCVEEHVGILATDASADNRFSSAESVINLQLRSLMCAPLIVKGEALGVIYVDNPGEACAFDEDDIRLLTAFGQQAAMALKNALLYEKIQRAYHQSILALINTIEAKDPYTMGHTQRTMRYALGIGKSLGLPDSDLETLKTAAQLHDIGKIGVRESLLTKNTQLTDKEYADMKAHVEIGVRILDPIEYLKAAVPIVRGHHEKYDGSGYPDGLVGEAIPLGARILGLADAFDAMTTQRPYNRPMSFQQALERCRESAGKHFDPACVEALARYLEDSIVSNAPDLMRQMSGTNAGNGGPAPILTR
mgnify:CR=1 FL=1